MHMRRIRFVMQRAPMGVPVIFRATSGSTRLRCATQACASTMPSSIALSPWNGESAATASLPANCFLAFPDNEGSNG